jgi:hypothetical protein
MGLEEGEEKEDTLYNQTPVDRYADSSSDDLFAVPTSNLHARDHKHP